MFLYIISIICCVFLVIFVLVRFLICKIELVLMSNF